MYNAEPRVFNFLSPSLISDELSWMELCPETKIGKNRKRLNPN
jgi:hypothetical protein